MEQRPEISESRAATDSDTTAEDQGQPHLGLPPRQPTLSTNRFALLSSATVRKGNLLKSPVARDLCKLTERMVVNMNGGTSQVSRPMAEDDVSSETSNNVCKGSKKERAVDESQDSSSEDGADVNHCDYGSPSSSLLAEESAASRLACGTNMTDNRLRRIEQQFAGGKKSAAKYAAKNCSQKNSDLLKSKSHQELQHKFTHLLVTDFEATCDSAEPEYPHEIIEFPCIAVDLQTLKVVAEFGTFVQPVKNPILTPFCTELTTIQQKDVSNAPLIVDAIAMFTEWLHGVRLQYEKETTATWEATQGSIEDTQNGTNINNSGDEPSTLQRKGPLPFNPVFATDGPWDMRKFMHECHVIRDGITFPELFYKWVDVRRCFSDFFHKQLFKLTKMLRALGMSFIGERHRGIDDSRNIARVAIALAKRGYKFRQTSSIPYSAEGSRTLAHERNANALLRELEEDSTSLKVKKANKKKDTSKGKSKKK